MDKNKENGISLVQKEVIKCVEEVGFLKKEVELYNDIYKEISEIVGKSKASVVYAHFHHKMEL